MKLIIDIDGTLCPIKSKDQDYKDLVPYAGMVKKLKRLKDDGAIICIYTSRNVKTYKGNVGLINKNTLPVILDWLDRWSIPYDEIIVGKPWPTESGFYVDDRSIRPREFVSKTLEELEEICKADRL